MARHLSGSQACFSGRQQVHKGSHEPQGHFRATVDCKSFAAYARRSKHTALCPESSSILNVRLNKHGKRGIAVAAVQRSKAPAPIKEV